MKLKRKHLAREITTGDLLSSAQTVGLVWNSPYHVVLRVDKCGHDWSMLTLLTAEGAAVELDVWNSDFRQDLFACWSPLIKVNV